MDQGEPSVKRQRTNEQIDENGNAAASAAVGVVPVIVDADAVVVVVAADEVPPNEERTADILKLNIDCFDEAFDYLALKDLISISRTCKRLRQVAGYCFRLIYCGKIVHIRGSIFLNLGDRDINIEHFVEFLRQVRIVEHGLQIFLGVQSKLCRLKEIVFQCSRIKASEVDRMKETLGRVEVLHLDVLTCYKIADLVDHCVNLRRLRLDLSSLTMARSWIVRKYPKLEYLCLIPSQRNHDIKGFTRIFELNPSLQTFATTAEFLCHHRDAMKEANGIKLDGLVIKMDANYSGVEFYTFCDFLEELHALNVYQRLHLYFDRIQPSQVVRLASLNGLAKLDSCNSSTGLFHSPIDLSALSSLQELRVYNRMVNVEETANNLINLRQLCCPDASPNEIIPFIRKTIPLDRIRVDYFRAGNHYDQTTKILDLRTLNQIRQQLPNARKITLYVNERVYLATKWALKETNFDLIQLKRVDSFEWQDDFAFRL